MWSGNKLHSLTRGLLLCLKIMLMVQFEAISCYLIMKVKVAQLRTNSLRPHGLTIHSPWNSPGQYTGVGSCSLLQGIFPTWGWNPGLPHCRRILYQLSHKGSPRILEWVAYPFSSGSSPSRNQTQVSWIAGGFFINWAIREAQYVIWGTCQKEVEYWV